MSSILKTRLLAALLTGALLSAPTAGAQAPAVPTQAAQRKQAALEEKQARRVFAQALQAETSGDWSRAFEMYSQAAAQAPGSSEYLMRREAARFQVIQQHVDRAERAAVAGQLEAARSEFEAALALDPTYGVVRERLAQMRPARPPAGMPPAEEPLIKIRPREGTRSFDYRGETRGAYEEVAQQFGVTASFDGDLRGKQIRFHVDDVDFQTALYVLGRQTNTFWRALDAHAFLVADNTPQKRRELAPVVLRTIALSELTTPEQMTEMVRLIRDIAGINRTQLDTRSRTLTVRDTPESVALAVRLVQELEQASGELMLEIEILEVDRTAAQRLGITPPSAARTFTISPADIDEAQASPEGLLRVLQRVFGGTGLSGFTAGQSTLGPLIPPLVAFGGGRSVLLATLPGATAEFADAFSILRGARRMMLRAKDGQEATFFIGERFPIVQAVLSANFAGVPLGNVEQNALVRRDLTAADGPAAVITGDFNSDAILDIAVANANADSISTFPGNGDGTFGNRTDIAVGTSPSAIVAADFNADTRLDLAVANELSNTVSILLGNGDGTFGAPANFSTGTGPRGLATADFNGNNLPDLVTANAGANTLTILLNLGGGSFDPRPDVPVDLGPRAVITGDFNGDTNLDLAVANEGANNVSLLLGNRDGTFTLIAGSTAGNMPVALATTDLNVDGNADLIVANQGDDRISVLLGNGDGTFPTITDFTVGDGPAGLAVGDFSGDGRIDLIVANQNADTFSILLGTGDGSFGVRADLQTLDGPVALAVADLNGDGRRDLVVAERDADSVSVILNQTAILPTGTPFASQPYPAFQYEDLGLKVRATPRLHPGSEVTLQLQIEIRSRTGQEINGIPVISNRTVEQTVRLRENERTLLTGILQDENRRGIAGWPGLARVPVAGRRDKDNRETELFISITPRRLRLAERVERTFYAGRETGATTGGAPEPPQ